MRPRDDRIIRRTSRTTTTYTVNGVQYNRLEDVPAEFRKHFEDKDGNGVPDIVDSMTKDLASNPAAKVTQVEFKAATTSSASSLSSLPPNLRRAVHRELSGKQTELGKIACSQCGYDLTGTAVGGKCPECGTEVSRTILSMTERPSSSTWLFNDSDDDPMTARSRFAVRELRRFLTSVVLFAMFLGLIFLIVKFAL